eukprot:scaffold26353_cov44-Attheya_sp.AAC.2
MKCERVSTKSWVQKAPVGQPKNNGPPWRVPSVALPREMPSMSYVGVRRMDDAIFMARATMCRRRARNYGAGIFDDM